MLKHPFSMMSNHVIRRAKNLLRTAQTYLTVVGIKGTLIALHSRRIHGEFFFKIKRPDCRFPFWLRIPSSDIWAYRQIFIDGAYDFPTTTVPQVIVDAGANTGLASIYFTNKFPDAQIIAIEPEQSNFDALRENTMFYPNIIPVQAAVWNANETVDLVDPGRGTWGFIAVRTDSKARATERKCHAVEGMTIDTIMETYDLKKINLLKIDIEGSEKEVFSNTRAWIDRVDAIIIELHERLKPGCNHSFYCGINGFDTKWHRGANVYVARKNCTEHVSEY